VNKIAAFLAAGVLAAAGGCESENHTSGLADELSTVKHEKAELAARLKQLQAENRKLKTQVRVLSGVRRGISFEDLHNLRSVRITGYTNLYDKDQDGRKEKLIVYIQPIDKQGDVVKAPGSVEVQLWDLNNKENEALLGEWTVRPDKLKKLWFSAILGTNYRLTFDVADKVRQFEGPLTVKVKFSDYLTGRTFEEQRVISPH
jgi:hypothetical protein